jgi:t-SNARE complex subunit (syntaxin)
MKEAIFTMKLEPDLRDAFMAEAALNDRSASQIVRELMRDYIEQRREAREYKEFLRSKVEDARTQMRAGLGHTNAEVEAEFAARRNRIMADSE